jgi:hypothetical protein
MQSSKSSTVEMLEQIPFRGRWLDSNWIGYCNGCKSSKRLWYGSADKENREQMEEDYRGCKDCPSCVVNKRGHKTVDIYERMTPEETIKLLWLMRNDTGIDFQAADEHEKSENKQEIKARENQIKSDWYLQKMKG